MLSADSVAIVWAGSSASHGDDFRDYFDFEETGDDRDDGHRHAPCTALKMPNDREVRPRARCVRHDSSDLRCEWRNEPAVSGAGAGGRRGDVQVMARRAGF